MFGSPSFGAWPEDLGVWPAPLEGIRELLAPEYGELPDDELADALAHALGAGFPEEVETLVNTLTDFGQAVVRGLPAILPAVGTALAGPVGGVVGGLAGGAVGATAGATTPATPSRAPETPRRAQPRAKTAGSVPEPPGSSAAARLLTLLYTPELLQALLMMVLGGVGRRHVSVAGKPAPLGAFTNLLRVLTDEAAAEYNAIVPAVRESVPSYLLDADGEFQVDPAVPEQRAAALWELLQSVGPGSDDNAAVGWDVWPAPLDEPGFADWEVFS